MSHRLSRNARSDTPLARRYREARAAYKKAGQDLRNSCSAKSRSCGYPRRTPHKGPRFKFVAKSGKAMKAEFLQLPAAGGTNEDLLRAQLGHLNVKDPAQWEPIAEKFEVPIETFDEAFEVLAKAAHGRGRKPDWRKLDIEILRSCPGLDQLQLPTWIHESKTEDEQRVVYEEAPF